MMKKFVSEKKRTAALLACIIGLTLVAGCASGGSSKEASEPAVAAAEEQASEPEAAAADQASEPAAAAKEQAAEPAAAVAEEQSAEPGAAAEESSDPAAAEEASNPEAAAQEQVSEQPTVEASSEADTAELAAMAEASEQAAVEEPSGEASAEIGSTDAAATVSVKPIAKDELKAASEGAESYEGEIKVVLHSSLGEDVVMYTPEDNEEALQKFAAMAGRKPRWIGVDAAGATSTLYINGYNYSVWNMLDWNTSTCWAEGEPRSEGLWEGFQYWFDRTTRIDGFRIYPGYQKNKRVYRNNIFPRGVVVTAGGYDIDCNLDKWLRNINNDGEWYYVDIYFSSPLYDNEMYVMIDAVGSYSSNPESCCCITEFHPFYFY